MKREKRERAKCIFNAVLVSFRHDGHVFSPTCFRLRLRKFQRAKTFGVCANDFNCQHKLCSRYFHTLVDSLVNFSAQLSDDALNTVECRNKFCKINISCTNDGGTKKKVVNYFYFIL